MASWHHGIGDKAMGLDGVELVMEFEDTFDVKISDEVASNLTTVRDVVDK